MKWPIYLIMPKPVWLMTVQEACKECNSLIDQIQAKYGLLDSGEYRNIDTPAFKAESSRVITSSGLNELTVLPSEPANAQGTS